MKQKNVRNVIRAGVVLIAFFAIMLCHGDNQADVSYLTFSQTDWSGGLSTNHVTQSGWNKYFSATPNITINNGKVELSRANVAKTYDSDTDFSNGALSNLQISGTGQAAKLVMRNYQDTFITPPDNANLPFAPYIGRYAPYVRAGQYIYSLWDGNGACNVFMRWSIADEKWDMMASLPKSGSADLYTGPGACLAWDGNDTIYALVGGNRTDFLAYSIAGNTWYQKLPLPAAVSSGGAIVVVPGTNTAYAFCGNSSPINKNKFYVYTIPGNISDPGSWADTYRDLGHSVGAGSSLVYVNNLIYATAGNNSVYFYSINPSNPNAQWVSLADIPVPNPPSNPNGWGMNLYSGMSYPGSGTCLYLWIGDQRYFARYDYAGNAWNSSARSSQDSANVDLPALPFPVYGNGYFYDPDGSGTRLKFLSNQSYSGTFNFNRSANKWDEESAPAFDYIYLNNAGDLGSNAVYSDADGTRAIYMVKNYDCQFYRYHLDFYPHSSSAHINCQWERLYDVKLLKKDGSFDSNFYGGIVNLVHQDPGPNNNYSNYIYAFNHYGGGLFGFGRYNIITKTWDRLNNCLPAPASYSASMTWSGNYIYLECSANDYGWGGDPNIYRYDPSLDLWEQWDNIARTYSSHIFQGTLYAADYPYTWNYLLAQHQKWDPNQGKWVPDPWDPPRDTPPHNFWGFLFGSSLCGVSYGGTDYVYFTRGQYADFGRFIPSTTKDNSTWSAEAPTNDYYSPGYWMGVKLVYPANQSSPYIYYYDCMEGFTKYDVIGKQWLNISVPPFMKYYGMAGQAFCNNGSTIYYIGTRNNPLPDPSNQYYLITDDVERIESVFGKYNILSDRWENDTVSASYSPAKYKYGNVVYKDGFAYCFLNSDSGCAWKYSRADKKWVKLINLPFRTRGPGHKAVYPGTGTYIYICEGGNSDRFWKYNTVTDSWLPCADLPSPYAFCSGTRMTADNTGVYVVFPKINKENQAHPVIRPAILKFNDNGGIGSWVVVYDKYSSSSCPFDFKAENNGICMKDNIIYLLDDTGQFGQYDLKQGTWSTLQTPGWNTAGVSSLLFYPGADDYIYCIHESTATGNKGGKLLSRYDPGHNTWSDLAPSPFNNTVTYSNPTGAFWDPAEPDIFYFYLGNARYKYPFNPLQGNLGPGINFNRYSISQNKWDEPGALSFCNASGSGLCATSSGQDILAYHSYGMEKYNINTAQWTPLTPISTGASSGAFPGYNFAWRRNFIYPGFENKIYGNVASSSGDYQSFFSYDTISDSWSKLASLRNYKFSSTYAMACKDRYIYAIGLSVGSSNKMMARYSLDTGTWDETTLPNSTYDCGYDGASLVYPGSGSLLYATTGGGTTNFIAFDTSTLQWKPSNFLNQLPVPCHGGFLFSPGFGDYIYFFVSYTTPIGTNDPSNYPQVDSGSAVYRYSISQKTWTPAPSLPFGITGNACAVYPGTGNFIYLTQGYDTFSLMKYQLFQEGEYVSDVKNISKNAGYGTITWNDNGKGSIQVQVRTSKDGTFAGDWSTVPKVARNSDLSTSTSVTAGDPYLQYKIIFYTDDRTDSTRWPELDNLTINYKQYPLSGEELISSPYNTADPANRFKAIAWKADLLTGTTINMQARTSRDGINWTPWLGPNNTSRATDDFSASNNYVMDSAVVLENGYAKLRINGSVYPTSKPVIQPVIGVTYSANNSLVGFDNIVYTPPNTSVKYQISNNGSSWYWWDGSAWVGYSGGFSQTNTAQEINDHLQAFVAAYPPDKFYYRAYLNSADGANTPLLDAVIVTTQTNTTSSYADSTGTGVPQAINGLNSDGSNDQWMQYKAILTSDGQNTPTLNEVDLTYLPARIAITQPNGGAWPIGSQQNITWSSQGIDDSASHVKIEYSTDNGNSWTSIIPSSSNGDPGSYAWTPLPNTPCTVALMKVSSLEFPTVYGVSAQFNIAGVSLSSPAGSAQWELNKTHTIGWTSSGNGASDNLVLQLSTNGGDRYDYTIVSSRPKQGTFDWTPLSPENNAYISNNCMIKIYDANNTQIAATSPVFSILPVPSITITSPAGGEEWKIGTQQTITWTNTGNINNKVDVKYSIDGGNNWVTFTNGAGVNNIGNSGTFTCTVPDITPSQTKIRVIESSVPTGRDTTTQVTGDSNNFSIVMPKITITRPAGGEMWVVGDTEPINWTTEGTIDPNVLRIEYSSDGSSWNLIAYDQSNNQGNGGTYSWIVPSDAQGQQVRVRIYDEKKTSMYDVYAQSNYFLVQNAIAVVLEKPTGGEDVTMGAKYDVKWHTIGKALSDKKFDIYYSTDSGQTWILDPNNTQLENSGTFSWTPPELQINTSHARVKIQCHNYTPIVKDESKGDFSILRPRITVTSPNGNESWYATGKYNITWDSVGSVGDVVISYSTDGGSTWTQIISGAPNTGTYSWPVVDKMTNQLKVKVTDVRRTDVTDTSDNNASIISPAVTVTYPVGNEEWVIGNPYNITWNSTGDHGCISRFLIQYSTDGGNNFTDIRTVSYVEGTSSYTYNWTVPASAVVSKNCKIKISDPFRSATSSQTSGVFSIIIPTINVTHPTNGESWPYGTTQNITWTALGQVSDNVTITYTTDGTTWKPIYTGPTTNHTYEWKPIPNDVSSTCRVKVRDNNVPNAEGISSGSFQISYPTLSVTSPQGGELLTATDTVNITWTVASSDVQSVNIDYSMDNFNTDIHQIATQPNTGTCAWIVPETISTSVRVRVTDTSTPAITGRSRTDFTILPFPVITIDSPNSGEIWRIGTHQTIRWHGNGGAISNNLKLEYSTDSGNTWKPPIQASNVDNTSHSYAWTIPDDYSPTCMVKITDNVRATTTDTSDSTFMIYYPKITLTSPVSGIIWAVNDNAPITWTSEGAVSDNLLLQYSTDNFATSTNIISGIANSSPYQWAVADSPSNNVQVRIIDSNRSANVLDTSPQFTIIRNPTVTVKAPNGGEEYVIGDTVPITWTSQGLNIHPLTIEYSTDNFATSSQIVASLANTGSYSWTTPLNTPSSTTLKIRIRDPLNSLVTDTSDDNFRIKGGFVFTAPIATTRWAVNEDRLITWTTRGQIANVDIDYSLDNGILWNNIATAVPNNNTYQWHVPDFHGQQVKFRVSDSSDHTVYGTSDNFNVVYYKITWRVIDFDDLSSLQNLKVRDSWWSDQAGTIATPIDHEYPYGTYTTFWSKDGYIERSTEWIADSDKTVTILLENQINAQIEWHAILSTAFSADSDTLNASCWLERRGKLVGANDVDRQSLTGARLDIYDGDTLIRTMTSVTPDSTGVFLLTWPNTGLQPDKTYFVKATVTYRANDYTSGASIDVSQAKAHLAENQSLQVIQAQTTAMLPAVTSTIPAQITAAQTSLETKLEEAKSVLKSDTTRILTATEQTIPQQITQKIETVLRSEILNRESTIRSGTMIMIRYRTFSGANPVIDVFNAANLSMVSKQAMTAASSVVAQDQLPGMTIYEYPLRIGGSWGLGDYTIVCSDPSKGTMDAMLISVIRTDLEDISSQVGTVLGTTTSLSNLKDVADTLNSQFSIIESALGKISTDLVNKVKEVASSSSDIESVYSQLVNIGKELKTLGANQDVNLSKLLDISKEKSQDIRYLKNKTQQLKAAMEINTKMVDNMAHKPVTQTWFEYK